MKTTKLTSITVIALMMNVFLGTAQVINVDALKLKAQPSETSGNINLEMSFQEQVTANLRIYSYEGKQISTETLEVSKGENDHTVDFSRVPKGSYIFKVDYKTKSGATNTQNITVRKS